MQILMNTTGVNKIKHTPNTKFDFIDRAAKGEVEAAAKLAEGYFKGKYECEKDPVKAYKWASYAAKKGNALAALILEELKR